MFWNKKKGSKGSLPDLPNRPMAAASMDSYNRVSNPALTKDPRPMHHEDNEEEIHALPSFPDSPMSKGFSQTAIKDAVENEDIDKELPELPDLPSGPPKKSSKVVEMEEWKPSSNTSKRIIEAPPKTAQRKIVENKPVFVRIDKFRNAKQSLETIKDKLSEVDELLKTIREVKMKEDQELSIWEREMESIKARIGHINSEIFEDSSY